MKKGFTLAELLGVIVILGLIALITVPAVTDSLKTYKSNLCETQLKEVVSAARTWAADNDNILLLPTTDGETYTISLATLSEYGYIDKKVNNPVTKEEFDPDTTLVKITRSGKRYTYEIDSTSLNSCKY